MPSRLLACWHIAVHVLAVVSVYVSGLAWPLKAAAAAGLVAHFALRRPPAPIPVTRHADGTWSLPSVGPDRLALRPGTAVGPFWARLSLGGAESPKTVTVLLVKDQLGAEDWRRLQAELRRRAGTGTV